MPSAERVIQEEVHHVILGEQLRDRREFVRANLVAGLIDPLLLLALPELVTPAQAVVGGEDLGREPGQDFLHRLRVLGCVRNLQERIVCPENLRQHPRGVPGGQRPAVGPFASRQLFALFQRYRDTVGVHQELILSQEAGEEHLVPMLVSALPVKMVDALLAVCLKHVAKLPAPGPELDTQIPLRGREVPRRLGLVDRQPLQCRPGAVFGRIAGRNDGPPQLVSQRTAQRLHRRSLPLN